MISKHPSHRELGIRIVKVHKSKTALVIGLWKYMIRIEL